MKRVKRSALRAGYRLQLLFGLGGHGRGLKLLRLALQTARAQLFALAVHVVLVPLQVRRFGEGFGARAADEGLLSSVPPLVVLQVRLVFEGLFAHLTGEGPLVAVHPLVFLQVGRADEGLAAVFAAVRLEARVDFQMFFQVSLRGEGFGADLADEGPVGRMQLLVFPHAVLVHEGLAAHLAGQLISVAVQQVLELHVARGGGPARGLLVLHVAHAVGERQRLRVSGQLFGFGVHGLHLLVVAGDLVHLLLRQLLQDVLLHPQGVVGRLVQVVIALTLLHDVVRRRVVLLPEHLHVPVLIQRRIFGGKAHFHHVVRNAGVPGVAVLVGGHVAFLRAQFVQKTDAEDLSRGHHEVDVFLLDGDLGGVHVIENFFEDVRADEVDLDDGRAVHLVLLEQFFKVVAARSQNATVRSKLHILHHDSDVAVLALQSLLVQ